MLPAAKQQKRSHHVKPVADSRARPITSFFSRPPPPPQIGRPLGPPKKRGRPRQLTETADPEVAQLPSPPPAPASASAASASFGKREAAATLGVKLQRINWGAGKALEQMTEAVKNWDVKTGPHLEHDKALSLRRYAVCVGIPYDTIQGYVCKDIGKRKQLGAHVGQPSLFSESQKQFAVDVVRRHDRGNDGLDKRKIVDLMHDLKPDLKRRSVEQAFDRDVRPKHAHQLTGIVKANPTTTKRTAITVGQQFRWHTTIDQALAFLREKNVGLTPEGKSFGEVIDHFVTGGDETCFLVSHRLSPAQPSLSL